MPRIVLINPPNHAQDRHYLAPPLGLLHLADDARRRGWDVTIIDFDHPRYRMWTNNADVFYALAEELIISLEPTACGVTSMGANAHVALELLRRTKDRSPEVRTLVGGPYFSSIAAEVQKFAPWIDIIARGRAAREFEQLFSEGTSSPRHHHQQHPFAAYELIDLEDYFRENPRYLLNYETGSGCIYRCSFCYSSAHHQDVLSVDPKTVVADCQNLSQRGARHLFFVNDNFLNDPEHASRICRALAAEDLRLTWNGYATLPQLTKERLSLMADSGCRALYLGIDAVSLEQQRRFRKRFVGEDPSSLEELIEFAVSQGITPTCAFLLDLNRDEITDLDMTTHVAARCAQRGARIRFNALAIYPGTDLPPASSAYSEARCRILLDCPPIVIGNPLARTFPALFPFHSRVIDSEILWETRLQLLRYAQRFIQRHPSYFLSLGRIGSKSLTDLFTHLMQETTNDAQSADQISAAN